MQLSKKTKLLIGFLTILPLIVYVVVMFLWISMISDFMDTPEGEEPSVFEGKFSAFFVVNMVSSVISMVLLGFYIIYIIKSKRVKKDSRAIWMLVVIFGSFIGQLVFWFMHIWPEKVNEEEVSIGPIFPKKSSTPIKYLYCTGCNGLITEGDKYCPSCGKMTADVASYSCSKCGKNIDLTWAVCAYCGEPFEDD